VCVCVRVYVFACNPMHACVLLTSAVCEAVQSVSFLTDTVEAARVVDAGVVTGPLKGTLVNI
jgi:hypothetical protein